MENAEEKCWIGLQEERGGGIRTCTCHSAGSINGVGAYLSDKYDSVDPQRSIEKLRRIIEMKDVVARRGKFLKNINALEKASDVHACTPLATEFSSFDSYYEAFFKEQGVHYAYLFTVDDDDPVNYLWVCLTRMPFALCGIEDGFQERAEFLRKKKETGE